MIYMKKYSINQKINFIDELKLQHQDKQDQHNNLENELQELK